NTNSLTWNEKINILISIAELFKSLHGEKNLQDGKLFHGNLHPGNLLINIKQQDVLEESMLLDLVSCWIPPTILSSVQKSSSNNNNENKNYKNNNNNNNNNNDNNYDNNNNDNNNNNFLLYGILPYIAPEILR